MLQRRENELRQRRKHVEKLLGWHQRLDIEEREIINMEQMVMLISTTDAYQTTSHEQINDTLAITVHHQLKRTNCQNNNEQSIHEQSLTNVTATTTTTTTTATHTQATQALEQTRFEQKKQKQIQKINKSLNTLKMISARSLSSDGSNLQLADEIVEIYGRQLNKLWKRLTGQSEEKFTSEKVYKLSKNDLEHLYEQAKVVVLKQFHTNDEFKKRLIDNSMSIVDESHAVQQNQIAEIENNLSNSQEKKQIVPLLNLASSSELSNEQKNNAISDSDQGYYFDSSHIEPPSENKTKLTESHDESLDNSNSNSIEDNAEQLENDPSVIEEDINAHQSDVQSDITEDSLNKPKFNGNSISPSEIQSISQTNQTQSKETENIQTEIPSADESKPSSAAFQLNLMNSTQMIEDTSFPHIEGQSLYLSEIENDINSISPNSTSPEKKIETDAEKYQSDDFEDVKTTDELISTDTATKITAQQSDEQSETNLEDSSYTKELEQRLMLIDEGLRELNETISHSPVLQNEPSESSSKNEQNIDENEENTEKTSRNEEISTVPTTENAVESESSKPTETNESEANVESAKAESDDSTSTDSIAAEIAASKIEISIPSDSSPQKRQYQYSLSASSIDYNKVPEADALKRTQIPPDADVSFIFSPKCTFNILINSFFFYYFSRRHLINQHQRYFLSFVKFQINHHRHIQLIVNYQKYHHFQVMKKSKKLSTNAFKSYMKI